MGSGAGLGSFQEGFKGSRFKLGFFVLFWDSFVFLLKCCNVQPFLAKCTYFTLVRQHHQHRFQHPPHVQPTSPSSPANRDLGFLHLQHHQFLCGKASWPKANWESRGCEKPPKATKPRSHLPQRNWQCRGCEKTNREEL